VADARVQVDVATRLAEGVLLGLRGLAVADLRALLPAVIPTSDAAATCALRLIEAAEARHDPAGQSLPLHTAADQLHHAALGDRRQEHAALGHLLAAEAFHRAGEPERSGAEVAAALEGAHRLGHVWLQLAALAMLQSSGRGDESTRRREELLTEIGTALSDEPARQRLRARWSPAP
jgi:hypothetical protein